MLQSKHIIFSKTFRKKEEGDFGLTRVSLMVGRGSLFWFDACFKVGSTLFSQALEKDTMVGRVSLFWFDACFKVRTTLFSQALEKTAIWLDACLFFGLTRALTYAQHVYLKL